MIEQAVIIVCGLTTVYLTQDTRPHVRRWACIVGLIAQPFWVYSSWRAQQWGILALTVVYFWGWGRGFLNFWIRRAPA